MPCQVPGRSKKLDSDFLVLFLDICLLYHLELLQRKYCLTAIIFVRCNDGFVEVSLVNVFITSPYKVHRHPTDVLTLQSTSSKFQSLLVIILS